MQEPGQPEAGRSTSQPPQQIRELDRIFEAQKRAFAKNPMPSAEERIGHLKRLKKALIKHQERIITAIHADYSGRSRDETLLGELLPGVEGLGFAIRRVRKWMKPERRRVGMLFQPAKARVYYQPKGVVGILVPWNYPLYLLIGPLTGALAAGNRVMIKTSRRAPETGATVKALLQEAFEEDHVAVLTGRKGLGSAFIEKHWDHLMFTGSTAVGGEVMRAAAGHLTPVTLELGGKSPAIIGPQVPMTNAAERIAFGKQFNVGQTCVAPDYVLCPKDRVDEFVEAFQDCIVRMIPTMAQNPQYTSMIDPRAHERLIAVLEDARAKGARVVEVNPSHDSFEGTRKLPLYVLLDVADDMRVMQEEIFGPVLPVIPYQNLEDAVASIRSRPRPLALYFFDYQRENIAYILAHTHSGGALINDTLMHVAQDDLPFGGIGDSGMGAYHGKEGFLTFSHTKGVMIRPKFNSARYINPPYGKWMHRMVYRFFVR
ncbi:MAG: coniferyl aldehyde dehydrogenase [Desulfobacteraceae bacterium]|jgi:coniferyl-aldehyde dehydrogenase